MWGIIGLAVLLTTMVVMLGAKWTVVLILGIMYLNKERIKRKEKTSDLEESEET